MMKTRTILRAWNGFVALAVALGTTAITACTAGEVIGSGGGQSTTGAGGGIDCSSFLDDPGTAIALHITNHRATAVRYSTTCLDWSHIIDGDGNMFPVQRSANLGNCAGEMENHGVTYGDCMSYDFVEIAPGASRDEMWDGRFHGTESMPLSCVGSQGGTAQCDRAIAPKAGPWTFGVTLTDVATSMPVEATKSFVYGTDASIAIDVN
jgi:hypothetical protein